MSTVDRGTQIFHVGPVALSGGLNRAQSSVLIKDSECTSCSNFRMRLGVLNIRDAITNEVTVLGSPGGILNGVHRYLKEDGSDFIVFLNSSGMWAYDGGSVYNLDSGGAGYISSGNDSTPWDAAVVLDTFLACNGLNQVVYWEGNTAVDGKGLTSHPSFNSYDGTSTTQIIGKYLASFAGRLFVGHTTEGGNTKATRVRWSAPTTYWEWEAANGAGAVDLADTPGPVVGLLSSAESLIVFKEDAIILATETGDPNVPIAFPTYLSPGCIAGKSVQEIAPGVVLFLGLDNVYMLAQQVPRPIGTNIWPDLISTLDYSARERVVSFVRPQETMYYLGIPQNGETFPSTFFVYNWAEDLWYRNVYPYEIYGSARFTPAPASSIDSDTRTIDTVTDIIDTVGAQDEQPPRTVLTCSQDSTKAYRLDLGNNDVGVSDLITGSLDTKDFRLNPEGLATLKELILTISGSGNIQIKISVSTDFGTTWPVSTVQTIDMTKSSFRSVRFWLTATGVYHRLRLETLPSNQEAQAGLQEIAIHSLEAMFQPRETF